MIIEYILKECKYFSNSNNQLNKVLNKDRNKTLFKVNDIINVLFIIIIMSSNTIIITLSDITTVIISFIMTAETVTTFIIIFISDTFSINITITHFTTIYTNSIEFATLSKTLNDLN